MGMGQVESGALLVALPLPGCALEGWPHCLWAAGMVVSALHQVLDRTGSDQILCGAPPPQGLPCLRCCLPSWPPSHHSPVAPDPSKCPGHLTSNYWRG